MTLEDEMEELSDYEKLRLRNIKSIRQAFESTWSKGLKQAKQGLISVKKRTSKLKSFRDAPESISNRKSLRRKTELKSRILDKYLYCDNCQIEVLRGCVFHVPKFCSIKKMRQLIGVLNSGVEPHGLGVFNKSGFVLPVGLIFGPYAGHLKAPEEYKRNNQGFQLEFAYQILDSSKTKLVGYIEPDPHPVQNVLAYINCGKSPESQNVIPFQYCSAIYFRISKPIRHGDELLTFYKPENLGYPLVQITPRLHQDPKSEMSETMYKVPLTKEKVVHNKRFILSKSQRDLKSTSKGYKTKTLEEVKSKQNKNSKCRPNFRENKKSLKTTTDKKKLDKVEIKKINFSPNLDVTRPVPKQKNIQTKMVKKVDKCESWKFNCSAENEFDLYFSSDDENEVDISSSQLEFIPFI